MAEPHFVIVGLGSIGRRHARNLATLRPGARFTFVRHRCDEDALSQELSARVVGDVAAALDHPVDLAVVATPSVNHIDALPTLVDAGCPLLVEKPIVTRLADADALLARLAGAPPAMWAAAFNLRFLPSLVAVRALVAGGELGAMVRATFIAGQWLPDWRPGTDYRDGYSADAERGGGVELDLAHEFDVARWLLGELAVDHAAGRHATTLEIRANDVAVAVLSPPDRGVPLVTVAVDYVARSRVRWYEIVAEGGRVEWSLDGRLELATDAGRRALDLPADAYDVGATYSTMLREVLRAVADDDPSGIQTLADGLASTRLAIEVRDRGGAR